MTIEIPDDPYRDWPPVISSARVPRLVRVRDFLLTCLMWLVLGLILYTELRVAYEAVQVLRGRSDAEIDLALVDFYHRIQPLLVLIAVLTLILGIATLVSRARRLRAMAARQPGPLDARVLADTAGLDPAALAAAQALKLATAHRLPDGGLRVVEGSPAGE